MWTTAYWKDLTERVVSSAAGGALTAWGGGEVANLWTADARLITGMAAGAALISLLKGLAAVKRGDPASASLLR